MIKNNERGFTMIEIMIVVSVLSLLASIAFSNYAKGRESAMKSFCAANVKQIDGGLQMAVALEHGIVIGNLTEAEIEAIVVPNYLRSMPDCRYGNYTTDANGEVHCDFAGHQ